MDGELMYTLRVRMEKAEAFFGPGVARLLSMVGRTGSLQNAAASMGMSYSKAWKLVRTAEKELGFAMMERHVGGAGGGSSCLTPRGRDFIERYERFERELYLTADKLFADYFGGYNSEED